MGKKMSTLLFIVFCMFGGEFYGQNIYKEHITWESVDIAREHMYSDSCHVSELYQNSAQKKQWEKTELQINSRNFSTCTVETVCCFLPQCGQLKKHGKNQIKSKKTCFFLFLFCFLTVFLICTFVQNYNRTGRNFLCYYSCVGFGAPLWAIHVYRQEAVGWKCVARGKVYRFARNLTVSAAPLEGKLNFYVQLTSDFDSCTNNFFQVNKLEFVGNLTISEL